MILAGAQAIISIDEDDSWLDHDDPPHSFATNMWWRLANYTVKTSGMKGNCYVCTLLPHSTDNLIMSMDTVPQVVSPMGTVIAVPMGLWCVERKTEGESKLGQIPLSHCKEVWKTSTAGGCCLNCLLANIDGHPQLNETQCKARDGLGLGMMITQLTWK